MKLCGLAFVVAALMASIAIPAEAATVFRVLKKSNRAVFKLNDSELLKVSEGDVISMSGPSGKKVSGKVVKLMDSRALVKVNSGFSAISKDADFTLLAQNEVEEDDYSSSGVSSSTMGSGGEMELGNGSPSPFANEYQQGAGGDVGDAYGKEEAAHIVRVPRWQAGGWYDHIVTLDLKAKNDDADFESKVKSKGISAINLYGILHMVPKFWIGGMINLDDAKTETETETDAGEATSKSTSEIQTITLMGAFQVNSQWVLGLAFDSVSDDLEREGDAGSSDGTISYTRVRPSVAYYGDKFEVVVSHRARYDIDEEDNFVSEPAVLKSEAEMYISDATSLRGMLMYIWYNKADQDEKNLLVPSFGIVQRLGKNRFESELLFRDNHYRDDGESISSVRLISLTAGYWHMFTQNVEGHGGLEYFNYNGGDDTKVTGSAIQAVLGINYKG